MKKIYRLILEISLIIALLLLIREMFQFNTKHETLIEESTQKNIANLELKKLNGDYEKSLIELRKANNDLASFYFSEYHLTRLKSSGVESAEQLFNNLSEQSHKIKVEGIHGSVYFFISGKPLKNNWYIAEFEDGYSTGTMLLSYSVTKGIISWRPLEIILD